MPSSDLYATRFPSSFTPDGDRLAFYVASAETAGDIWTVALEGSDPNHLRPGNPEVFLRTPAHEGGGAFSPDGRWLAYMSDESGAPDIYVRPSQAGAGTGGKSPVSSGGGLWPVWSPEGGELFFRTPENRIMVAACIVKGDSFSSQKPRVWSEKRFTTAFIAHPTFDIAPDGKRAAVIMPADLTDEEKARSHQIVFLQNFFDELRRRVR